MTSNPPVDYFIVGLGNFQPEYETTRHNVGFICVNYITNLIAMEKSKDKPEEHKLPIFFRRMDLNADIHDIMYQATDKRLLRLVFIKPLTGMNNSGLAVQKVLQYYGFKDISKQLIVIFDDLNSLPGTLTIQNSLGAVKGHKGIDSIEKTLNNNTFYHYRIGIGRPPSSSNVTIPNYVLGEFTKEKQEMDLVGYSLSLTAKAFDEFSKNPDNLKAIKKKYCSLKKIPKNLNKMESLIFPIDLHGY